MQAIRRLPAVDTDAGDGVIGSWRKASGVLMKGFDSGCWAPSLYAIPSKVDSILSKRLRAWPRSSVLESGLDASAGRLYTHSIPRSAQKEQAGFAASF